MELPTSDIIKFFLITSYSLNFVLNTVVCNTVLCLVQNSMDKPDVIKGYSLKLKVS